MIGFSPGTRRACSIDTPIFDQTLAQPDEAGYCNDERYQVATTTAAVGFRSGAGDISGEKHAERDCEIAKNFCVTCQRIRKQYISELATLCLCQPSDANAPQGDEESMTSGARETIEREYQQQKKDCEIDVRYDFIAFDPLWGTMRDGPKQEECQDQRNRKKSREMVRGGMMRLLIRIIARWVPNESGNILESRSCVSRLHKGPTRKSHRR